MTVTVSVHGRGNISRFTTISKDLGSAKWKPEAMRGVIDAGRQTKTVVQKSVAKQMAIAPGKYGSAVVAHMRQSADKSALAFRIFAVRGGQPIENYKGLKVVKSAASQKRQAQAGRAVGDIGAVRSEVWNKSRIFKRSFAATTGGVYFGRGGPGFFAFLPGNGKAVLPASAWTYGLKPELKRDAKGRFIKGDRLYGKKRALYGPSLRDEIGKGETLATFQATGAALLDKHVSARMAKFIKF